MRHLPALCLLLLAACAPRMLQPQMAVQTSMWDQPAATIGGDPGATWTNTTVEAAVNHQPLRGRVMTIVGEVVDMSCYLELGKHGTAHHDCAVNCIRNGAPIGILTRDAHVYLLMEEEHHPRRDGQTNLREQILPYVAEIVRVTGTVTEDGPMPAIYVQGYVRR